MKERPIRRMGEIRRIVGSRLGHDHVAVVNRVELLKGALLDKLVEHGWITGVARHECGRYVFGWTPKGVEYARFLRVVTEELELSPRLFGMLAIFSIRHGLQAGADEIE